MHRGRCGYCKVFTVYMCSANFDSKVLAQRFQAGFFMFEGNGCILRFLKKGSCLLRLSEGNIYIEAFICNDSSGIALKHTCIVAMAKGFCTIFGCFGAVLTLLHSFTQEKNLETKATRSRNQPLCSSLSLAH